jgi:ParB family chromosome partitioning protein
MTDITQISLNELVASEDTVRRTAPTDAGLQERAASIAAHGLLQSLVVRKHRKATYAVVAGGRLLAALQLLAEHGSIDASFAVPCQVQDGDDATELSLVETTLREQMHPADEFEASRNHLDNGTPVEDIAAHFRLHAPRGRTASQAGPRQPPFSSALFVPVN